MTETVLALSLALLLTGLCWATWWAIRNRRIVWLVALGLIWFSPLGMAAATIVGTRTA